MVSFGIVFINMIFIVVRRFSLRFCIKESIVMLMTIILLLCYSFFSPYSYLLGFNLVAVNLVYFVVGAYYHQYAEVRFDKYNKVVLISSLLIFPFLAYNFRTTGVLPILSNLIYLDTLYRIFTGLLGTMVFFLAFKLMNKINLSLMFQNVFAKYTLGLYFISSLFLNISFLKFNSIVLNISLGFAILTIFSILLCLFCDRFRITRFLVLGK